MYKIKLDDIIQIEILDKTFDFKTLVICKKEQDENRFVVYAKLLLNIKKILKKYQIREVLK